MLASRMIKMTKTKTSPPESVKEFKCFYCDQLCSDDKERINHIGTEHPGKLHYPTPADFENRSGPQRQQQGGENQ
jgi:hypothetical protein